MPVLAELLIDNDIFIVLAGAKLLSPAISILGFEIGNAKRLDTLPYVMRKNMIHTVDVIERVIKACKYVSVIDTYPDATVHQQLSEEAKIDVGEALLYALLAENGSFLLTSNDKNAMRSLTLSTSLHHIKAAIAGRVICLETILLMLIEKYGVERIGEALAPVISTNVILRVAFSPGCIAMPDECRNALSAYHQYIIRDVGGDFLWNPA